MADEFVDAYTNEAELRDLLAETPSLLPGIDEGLAAASKEMPIPGTGKADVVIVDAGGEITVVECKLRANPEIRRRVVGQLLAYASAISQMSFADFDGAFRRSNANRSLSDGLVPGNDLDEEEFRAAVDDNLRSGRMRLIIAVDEITEELKRTVTYLNSHTTTNVELLALEMRRAVDEGVEVLLPATYGEESAARKSGPLRASTARRCSPSFASRTSWPPTPRKAFSTGPMAGLTFATPPPLAFASGRAGTPLLIITRGGQLRVVLKTLSEHGERDDERIEQLVQDLAEIGVQLEPKGARPKTPLEPLADDTRRQRFLTLMEQVLDTLTSEDAGCRAGPVG